MDGYFETLVYTDCRPGQGLRGSAGLQFQARSNDAVAAAETLVKDHLLYEPPSRWMADRRPVEDYPPSFAHLSASGYLATAAGVYRGREANGVREGNQLTHAIVTTDADTYAGLRPAQLFGAAFWSSEPAPTTRSEPVKLSASGGPYTPARAKQFVLNQTGGAETLLDLVSALERAGKEGAGRVMFVGDDVATIVEWLVAGTLLVPRARALELGFKIYSNDPARSSLPVVAVHPEFAGASARLDNQLGYVVFDLVRHRNSPVEESPAARRWVDLFLAEDPRDAVDALDVAAESDIKDAGAAAALGLAAILHREPVEHDHAKAIVGWLREGPQRLRDAYGTDLADIFVNVPERWPRDVLRLLDRVGSDGLLLPGEAADVRMALVFKDIDGARRGGAVTAERPAALPAGEWGQDQAEQVRRALIEVIREPGAGGPVIEALLRVARCYSADITRVALGDAGRELARYVADHPGLMRPEQWPDGVEIDELLIAELAARVRRGRDQPALVGDDWRHWLERRGDLPRELEVAALGALVRHRDDRKGLVKRTLRKAAADPGFYAEQVEALFSQSPPTPEEIHQVLTEAPDGTPAIRHVFDRLTTTVAGQGPVLDREIGLCSELVEKGLLEVPRPLEVVLSKARRLYDITGRLKRGVADPDQVRALTKELVATPSRLIAAYQPRVIDALAAVPHFARAEAFFGDNFELLDPYLRRLAGIVKAEELPAPAVAVFWLTRDFLHKDSRQPALDKILDQWVLRAPDKQIAAAGELIKEFFAGKDWIKAWAEYVDSLSGRRRRYRLAHPFGGRS
jgi:hypothetical protein